MLVAGLDWHPVTNRIVTAAHDRNAFVWDYDAAKDAWKPTVVILAIDRAALDVKWSPDGTKFAVGSGNKQLQVCWYDEGNNWWAARTCKKEKQAATARSSVVAVAWHPNSQVIACASTDWTVRVLCAHVPEVSGGHTPASAWGAPAAARCAPSGTAFLDAPVRATGSHHRACGYSAASLLLHRCWCSCCRSTAR